MSATQSTFVTSQTVGSGGFHLMRCSQYEVHAERQLEKLRKVPTRDTTARRELLEEARQALGHALVEVEQAGSGDWGRIKARIARRLHTVSAQLGHYDDAEDYFRLARHHGAYRLTAFVRRRIAR